VTRLVAQMDSGVMEAALQNDAIAERAKGAVRGGVRLRQQRVGILDLTKRAGTGCNGACASMIRHP
jgi:hypothetical protein